MAGRLVVTGGSGYLGRTVTARAVRAGWSVVGTYFTHPPMVPAGPSTAPPVGPGTPTTPDAASVTPAPMTPAFLDVRDRDQVSAFLDRTRPDVVVHTASGRDDWPTIADGTAYLALAVRAVSARLVHLSSDAVFAGDLPAPQEYDESALPDPVYPYGAAKAAAETAVRAITPDAVVVRTSLILGDGHGGHERLTHDLVTGRRSGALFTDELRRPVHVGDLADAVLELAANDYRGVLNLAGADVLSRHELGVLVARRDGLDADLLPVATLAGSGLHRPRELRLSVTRAAQVLQTRLRGAREFLAPG